MRIPLDAHINRAKYIYQTEGLKSLIRQGFAFPINRIFQYQTYYYYKIPMAIERVKEEDVLPRIQDLSIHFINTNQQVEELVAKGFEDFRPYRMNTRERLNEGAIAFCIYIGFEFAHICWIATTEEAKNTLVSIPYRVDFSNGEVCVEDSFTIPKYRGKGLLKYSQYKRYEYLRQMGVTKVQFASPRYNWRYTPYGSYKYAKARYLKILWWKYWKETPITSSS